MHVLVLSPHRDDAAFSCGVLLHELVSEGNDISIVNVCTVSRYAPYVTPSQVDAVRQITTLRLQEDLAFVERMLATTGSQHTQVNLIDLDWQDLPLRWRTKDAESLARTGLRFEEVQLLARQFATLPLADLVLAPMALGGHLDHRLVCEAATRAFADHSILFYEDLPYACRMSAEERKDACLNWPTSITETWLPKRPRLSSWKRDYASCYPSQIADDVIAEMHSYTSTNGGRERFLGTREAIDALNKVFQEQGALA
jgi:LmbE family N-acetylglucosaminyl deacetylase